MDNGLRITTAIAAAMMASACGQQQRSWDDNYAQRDTAVCVDKQGRRVPDQQCSRGGGGGGSSAFLWYYLGRSSALPYYGEAARGGSYSRAPGATYFHAPSSMASTRATAISRGGFGSTARASVGS